MEESKKKPKNGKKIGLIVGISVVALVVIVLVYGFVITKSGYWLLSKFTPDTPEQQMSYTSAFDTAQTIAQEGFVLMQNNDGLLPLTASPEAPAKLNVFGMRSVQLIYNAGGSAASVVDKCVRLEDAMDQAGFELNQDLLNLYYNYYKTGKASIADTPAPGNSSASEFIENPSNITVPDVPGSILKDSSLYSDGKSVLDHALDFSDTAMIVVGRGGSEVFDFTPALLQLSEDEASMVDAVCSKFDKVILVVNSANAMELDFLRDYPQIKSVLWIGYPGESGIHAFASILNGTVNPSGRLVDTWLADNLATPAANNYLELQADGTWNPDSYHYTNTPDQAGYFTQYSEGIYVGYKYFETRAATDPSFDYDAAVMFPFGHGLSYTTFEKRIMAINEENGVITVRVEVKNTGDAAGKDVIQLYYNPPYTGAIEKSTVNLAAFKKTNLMEPGTTEHYSLEIPVEDMASYDYKVNKAYVLEKGDYEIMLMDDAHTKLDSQTWNLGSDIIYDEAHNGKRSSDIVAATNLFDYVQGPDDFLTREWNQDSRAFTGPKQEDFTASQEVLDSLSYTAPTDAELGLTEADLPVYGQTLSAAIKLDEMSKVPYDDPKWDDFMSQLTLDEMALLCGNGAWHIEKLERLGVPQTNTPDGSVCVGASTYSGAIMGIDAAGITYPCPVVTASSWNEDIAYMMGTSAGSEAQANGYAGWYAPAMDTHRTAFNGRNFEYYSEDGTLAGIIAGNVVKGATEKGVICFVKHFALNERESNDRNQLYSWCNEQAMREIYLKPFELAVKNGGSLGAMSSFNYIGTKWASANSELCKDLLRGEWGFQGLVITDAHVYPYMDTVGMIYGGTDLSLDAMGAWTPFDGHSGILKKAAEDSATRIGMTRNLYQSSKNILFAVSRTWPVAGK